MDILRPMFKSDRVLSNWTILSKSHMEIYLPNNDSDALLPIVKRALPAETFAPIFAPIDEYLTKSLTLTSNPNANPITLPAKEEELLKFGHSINECSPGYKEGPIYGLTNRV